MEWRGYERGSSGYRRMLVALLSAGVATFAQLYSVQGVLPLLQADLAVTPAESALAVSSATLGLAVAVVPWSAVSDRFGRRRTMIVAILAATGLAVASVFAPSFPLLVAVRFAEGAALGGIPAVAMAYLSEEVHEGHATMAAATYISGTSIGGLSGRIVAAPVGEWLGWRAGVLAVTVMAVVAAVVFISIAPRQRRFTPQPLRLAALTRRIVGTLADGKLLVLYAQAFLLMGSFVAVYNYLGFHLGEPPFRISPGWVSLLFLAYLSGTWSSSVAGRLAARHGRRVVLLGSATLMLLGAGTTLIVSLPAIILGLLLFTAGFFAAHSTANGWVPAIASAPAQAASFYTLAYYTGSSVVGFGSGLVFTRFGWPGFVGVVALLVAAAMLLARGVLPTGERGRPAG
ncbi:MFS transporter [uncultured Tessaracoccus sp.]|uniref:MFS transporter n=1 Tax=uncultured Tessaracoccus sp. TaxID=905023 RepID=UPI0025D700B3|nr:MFS transporter [uncultured Tessaracoccus sp.]